MLVCEEENIMLTYTEIDRLTETERQIYLISHGLCEHCWKRQATEYVTVGCVRVCRECWERTI